MGMMLHNIQIGGTVLKSTLKENDLGLNISAGMSSVELQQRREIKFLV